jgi:thymidine kinase
MASVYFYYSAMNAGKTTLLLQARHNYLERDMHVLCLKPELDTRDEKGKIVSRVGLAAPCQLLSSSCSLYATVCQELAAARRLDCVLIDEAQFLSEAQVEEAFLVCDTLDIPVMCYGLRSDFLGNPFPASVRLLAKSDNLIELKTICHCGKKATMNLRMDAQGKAVTKGEQILVGGNDRYVALCRKHFQERLDHPSTKSTNTAI